MTFYPCEGYGNKRGKCYGHVRGLDYNHPIYCDSCAKKYYHDNPNEAFRKAYGLVSPD